MHNPIFPSQVLLSRGTSGIHPKGCLAIRILRRNWPQVVEDLLSASVSDCYKALEMLGDRDADETTWDFVSAELALAYLTLGVRRRQAISFKASCLNICCLPAHELTFVLLFQALLSRLSPGAPLTPGATKRVTEPLAKAEQIYAQLGDEVRSKTRYL